MHNPMDTARIHLEEGLRKCVRGKFTIANGNRSGTVMNLLHEAIYHAYAVLLANHGLADSLELCGEHEGKIALP